MTRPAVELTIALTAVLVLTGVYVALAQDGIPRPGGAVGLTLGIVGFALMLAAQTLYTRRKQTRRFAFGPTYVWLQMHVVVGIVGPYLVLLHSAGRFHGLAGVTALLTIVLVLSGFVGRYLYTETPRTLEGDESRPTQAVAVAATRRLLALWRLFHIPLAAVLFTLAFLHIIGALYYGTFSK